MKPLVTSQLVLPLFAIDLTTRSSSRHRAFQDHREKWCETAVDLSSISKRRGQHGPAGSAGTNRDFRLHRQRLYSPQGRPRRPLRCAHPRGTR